MFDGNCVSGRFDLLDEEVAPNLKDTSVERYLKNAIGGERMNNVMSNLRNRPLVPVNVFLG